MALKITLKPGERMIIGAAVVKNGKNRADLIIENNVPIMRDKDVLSEEKADTPCKRIYFVVQLMYVDEKNLAKYHHTYWELAKELVAAAPSTAPFIDDISGYVLNANYYKALKTAKKLIDYEKEVTDHVRTEA